MREPIAVLGGGITGLCAASRLRKAGLQVVVFEASARAGGVIQSVSEAGWLYEAGPNSLLEGLPEVVEAVQEAGLVARRLYAGDAAKNRYVVRSGRLQPVPTSPGAFLTTRLFSTRAKLRLATEILRPAGRRTESESVAEFTVRRLGREFLDYAIDPFVAGVYAGDPRKLSVRHGFPKLLALEKQYGSLLKGAIRKKNTSGGPSGKLFSFVDGLEELPRALAGSLCASLRLGTRIVALRPGPAGWTVVSQAGSEMRQETFSAVVSALPADALSRVRLEGVRGLENLGILSEIEQPPVSSVFMGFRREDVAHPLDGFGILAPRVEKARILGTLFSSSLFPGRAPEGHVALTTFVGGTRQPELAQLDDDALAELACTELAPWIGLRGKPVFLRVWRHARAIPQYNLGYDRFQDAITAAEAAAPGLFIGGNCRDGISVAACITAGKRLADAVIARQSSG
jgi:protoporphyrinogen/coproporphyrinogen III oxidase